MSKALSRIHPVDLVVGQRVRMRRLLLGLSLSQLAKASRVSAQQLLKYEGGSNRISASRLSDIAKALRVNVTDLFPSLSFQLHATTPFDTTFTLRQTDAQILREILRIKDPGAKTAILDLLRAATQSKKRGAGAPWRGGRQLATGAFRAR